MSMNTSQYIWDSTNSKWVKARGTASGDITVSSAPNFVGTAAECQTQAGLLNATDNGVYTFFATDTEQNGVLLDYSADAGERITWYALNSGSLAATDVSTGGLVTIDAPINTTNIKEIFVTLANTVAALTALEIQVSADGTNFFTLYSSAGEYQLPEGHLLGTSGDLTTLGAGSSGWFILDCEPFRSIRLQATAGATNSISSTWSGK